MRYILVPYKELQEVYFADVAIANIKEGTKTRCLRRSQVEDLLYKQFEELAKCKDIRLEYQGNSTYKVFGIIPKTKWNKHVAYTEEELANQGASKCGNNTYQLCVDSLYSYVYIQDTSTGFWYCPQM